MPGRDISACLGVVQALQNAGLHWMSNLKTRAALSQAMQYYMTRIGLNLDALPHVIHIAGTKGKGSTAACTESILRHAGLKTGLYTSPHLISICERYRIDGKPVDSALFLKHFWQTWDVLNEGAHKIAPPEIIAKYAEDTSKLCAAPPCESIPSSPVLKGLPMLPGFNFLTLVGFKLFVDEGVDVLVCEVGLGGRLDATNVIDEPAVCGIATLDFDHVELLGYTLKEIAAEKAGIFKAGVPAVTVSQRQDAMESLRTCAAERGTPLFRCAPDMLKRRHPSKELPVLGIDGHVQYTNAALAVALTDIYMHQLQSGRLKPSIPSEKIKAALHAYGMRGEINQSKRRSSFSDGFGASTMPPIGDTSSTTSMDGTRSMGTTDESAGIPLYDYDGVFHDCVLLGLQRAKWPGRNHLLHVDPKTLLPCETGRLIMYMDGAHTQHSMQNACKWFVERSGLADVSSDSPHRKRKYHLIFNCGTDKNAIQLLLPLSVLPFDSIHFAPVPWMLASRSTVVSMADAMKSYIRRLEYMDDKVSLQLLSDGAAMAGKSLSELCEKVASSTDDKPVSWQQTLSKLLLHIQNGTEFTALRHDIVKSIGVKAAAPSECVSGAGAIPSGTPHSIHANAFEAVKAIVSDHRVCATDDVEHHIFVTGSLYLVGHMLESLGAKIE